MARMATLSRSERDAAALREPLDCQTEAPKRGVCPRDNRIAAAPVLVAHCCFGAAGRGSGGLAAQLVERQRSRRLAPCAGVSRCVPGQEWGSRARRVGAVRAPTVGALPRKSGSTSTLDGCSTGAESGCRTWSVGTAATHQRAVCAGLGSSSRLMWGYGYWCARVRRGRRCEVRDRDRPARASREVAASAGTLSSSSYRVLLRLSAVRWQVATGLLAT